METLEKKKLKDIQDRYLRVEDVAIKRASKEQLQIRNDHIKLSQGLKNSKTCLTYLSANLQTHLPDFSQELKQNLRHYKKQERH